LLNNEDQEMKLETLFEIEETLLLMKLENLSLSLGEDHDVFDFD
jgi:hypothetical protein